MLTDNPVFFLAGGGEAVNRINAADWKSSPLGAASEWTPALKAALSIVLRSPDPTCLLWGESFVPFPNDAFFSRFPGENMFPAETFSPELLQVLGEGNEIRFEAPSGNAVFALRPVDGETGIAGILVTPLPQTAPVREKDPYFLFEQLPMGITVLGGEQFIVESANSQYLEIVDRKSSDFLGRSLFDALPEVREVVEPLLTEVLKTGVPYHGREFPVYLNRYGKKEHTYFNFVYYPRRNMAGDTDGVIVVAFEVTDIVKAKRFLEEGERRFRHMVVHSPIAMTIFRGEDFIIDTANTKMFEDIWRLPAESVLGRPALEVFPELSDQKFPELLRKVLNEGVTHTENEAVAYVMGSDGMRRFYLDFQYAPMKEEDDTIAGVMITVYDITERVEARKRLEESESRFRLLADSMPQFVWSGPADGNLDYFNDSLYEYAGLTEEECKYGGWIDIVHPDDREQNITAWLHALETGEDFHFEHRFRKHDGTYRWQLSRAVALRDDEGTIYAWVGTSTDIDDHKTSAKELEKLIGERTGELMKINEDLEKTNRELQSFAFISSHDLQEPLRKIQMFSGRILDLDYKHLSPNGKHYFDRMAKAAGRMQMLLDDLLAYSRSSLSTKHLDTVDIDRLVAEVIADLREEIAAAYAHISVSGLETMEIVPFQFRQLFYNLISNSLKFVRDGVDPEIRIAGKSVPGSSFPGGDPEKTYFHIRFSDNGIGFEQQYGEKIFDFFQRLNDREAFTGTGMGLSIVRRIVENHGGIIRATGTPGEGAVFELWFPKDRD